ncbi:MAG: tRNA pseudouridine(38-40) synthase TruA [Treponema sp.]|jgi:tRNA pseudouridine38-40 synthase|nr:tRNA pseudouridine(38-40) synthase TruA [Treponema sp.]
MTRHVPGRNIKLLIAYDGTDFSGWQKQGGYTPPENSTGLSAGVRGRTVQGVIEQALAQMHKEPVTLTGSGRTDSGVHAAGQVANFYTTINNIPPDRFVPALNGLLPADVRILSADETRPDFHARFDARMRTYRYHCICGRHALPHENRYNLQLWRYPRLETLNAYCRLLLGERDCSVFAGAGDMSVSRSRYIFHAGFMVEAGRLIFEISANAFLWKMVRSIAGTFLHYEERGSPPEELRDIIASGDRSRAGPTLPPQGLFLWKIDYYRA